MFKAWLIGSPILLTFSLLPLYLFPSGGFQIVDIAVILSFATALLSGPWQTASAKRCVIGMLPFVLWAVGIDLAFYIVLNGELSDLKKAAAIAEGFVLFFAFSKLFDKLLDDKVEVLIYLGLCSSFILCFLVKGDYQEGVRNALSFNNPNQLGYFSVLSLSFLILAKANRKETNFHYAIMESMIVLFAHLFVFLSLSRGALLAFIILDAWIILHMMHRRYVLPLVGAAAAGIAYVIIINPGLFERQMEGRHSSVYDLENVGSGMKDRVLIPFEEFSGMQVLIGINGNVLNRGNSQVTSQNYIESGEMTMEVHNLFGEVIRSYGLIGLLLFGWWLVSFVWKTRLFSEGLWVWTALLAYNMTHNGIRFRSFWILIALMTVIVSRCSGKFTSKQPSGAFSSLKPLQKRPAPPAAVITDDLSEKCI